MNYIVLDLEWNQGYTTSSKLSGTIPFEIIEIGAVKLNSDKVMVDEFSEIVCPTIYKTVHYMTGKLVQLDMKELKKGLPFLTVMQKFLEWCGTDYVFCTWGPLDLYELQRNMAYYKMEPLANGPFPFYDVQKLYAIECDEQKRRLGLETAVDLLKIEKDIPFHRAFSDAYYTAKVLSCIHRKETFLHYSYDVFNPPKDKESEITVFFGDYSKYISRTFETKEELLSDKTVRNTDCYICKKHTKRIAPLFTVGGRFYLSVHKCETHGYMKVKIRIKKSEDDKYFTVKTKKIISEDTAKSLVERYKKCKEGKKAKNKE